MRPPKEVVSAAVGTSSEEKSGLLDSVQAGSSQAFTLDFTEVYQGLTLPAGDYRIAISFDLSSKKCGLILRFPEKQSHVCCFGHIWKFT